MEDIQDSSLFYRNPLKTRRNNVMPFYCNRTRQNALSTRHGNRVINIMLHNVEHIESEELEMQPVQMMQLIAWIVGGQSSAPRLHEG